MTIEMTGIEDDGTPQAPAQLREAYNRLKSRNEQLEARLAEQAFAQAGFDGKRRSTLEKYFQGDRTDPKAIREFAKSEFDWEPGGGTGTQGENTPAPPAPTAAVDRAISEMEASAPPVRHVIEGDTEVWNQRAAEALNAARQADGNQADVQDAVLAILRGTGLGQEQPT